ncbi:leucine zipper transcription factor-like protein 1 isoform X1 [Dreissena polymorpha]|uniref:leucine zipper transcription factor-like protein 1 isoform X1 n=2 Tax=Dreissena polymorpha TaxID=45954 RepID=UPI002264D29E|nr:leucine zipper transcription factor-like protein 1 isoform X1 [Dreissena polymorpha]
MATELNVNEHHSAQIYNYIRFTRYQRGQRMRAVDFCFDELISTRLDETTYTIDEVKDMLNGLLMNVQGELEGELVNSAHTNVLLLRQMFMQAEKWHLKLSADISELENRDILDKIAEFEEQQFAGTKRDTDFHSVLKHVKLGPMNESGGTQLLHMKIEELQQQNDDLKMTIGKFQSGSDKQRQMLEEDLRKTQAQMKSGNTGVETEELRRKMAALQSELDKDKKTGKGGNDGMESDLVSTKHELLRVRDMLEMAEKELEKKVSQTQPFKNLKQMLMKKNDTMKELRKRLQKYESVDDE